MTENPQTQKIPLIFALTEAGSEPVREWLKGLPEAERQAIGKDLLRAQWRWPGDAVVPGRWETGYGKSGRTCQRNARLACCSAFTARTSSRCMDLLRKRVRRRMRIWHWRECARRS